MHILWKIFISISLGLSQKKEIEKWLLRTSFQCIVTGAHQRRQVDEKWLPLSTDQF